ncbi:ligase-associated DNA damage response endonuclease PdeM [Salipiger sp. 1_MG-2023]|uniref:ligase-associated DNA damage response endonuclease PdeM n=1 Tax=Salipiger sp. 1_MG-2023 TaxID=3062665 RepID=UPI0026E1600F|nr:ligase-associated DNA damage response endonuclease PdeM [Salipiger sp. 1_MG-2023]MDO6587282.1 ligase-associated DNA damage response endonuclease PdeM [Salipiger sp. 1_MG-2023]
MNTHDFRFHGADLRALPSGALHWPGEDLLVVSDLHFGKSARLSAVGGAALPPYETRDTLLKLDADLEATQASRVICLGDSFDAIGIADELPEDDRLWILRLQAGRSWIWIEGNHDPDPAALGGTHLAEARIGPLLFRHIAQDGASAEVSGHYHPKALLNLRGRRLSRPCFLIDAARLIMPAYGAYTGGLRCDRAPLNTMMGDGATAILTGPKPCALPMPRRTLPAAVPPGTMRG